MWSVLVYTMLNKFARGDFVNSKLKQIVYTAVFAAMIFVLSMFLHIPAPSGYVHLGDSLIYICAMLLGSPWALLAGALGEGLADAVGGFAIYAPATVIIKVLVALPFTIVGKRSDKLFTPISALLTLPAGLITVGGYFIADLIIDKSYAVVDLPGNAVQAAASAVVFIILAAALDRAKIKDRLK